MNKIPKNDEEIIKTVRQAGFKYSDKDYKLDCTLISLGKDNETKIKKILDEISNTEII